MTAMVEVGGGGAHSIEIWGIREMGVLLKDGGIKTLCTLWPQDLREKIEIYWSLIRFLLVFNFAILEKPTRQS